MTALLHSRGPLKLLFTRDVNNPLGALGEIGCVLLGGLVGWLAWGGDVAIWRLSLILVLPLAWGLTKSRWAASLLMASYYCAGARGLPFGSAVFFGDSAPVWFGWLMWSAACALLTLPYVVLWSAQGNGRGWRFLMAVCVSAVPPLAIVGWLNPVTVAGVLFPNVGWLGVILTLGLMAALADLRQRRIALLSVIAVAANALMSFVVIDAPAGWRGMNTNFPQLSSAGADDAAQLLAGMRRVEWVKELAKSVPAHAVVVLPETVLGSFDGVAAFALKETEAALRLRGARMLVGAEVLQSNNQYKNGVLVLGAAKNEDRFAVQNIPVPVAMWRPWSQDGAVASVFGRENMVLVGGVRAGALVCYEQLLAYSVLWAMSERPDVLLSVSNVWWARDTSIPAIQRQTMSAFGRLFGVSVLVAQNT